MWMTKKQFLSIGATPQEAEFCIEKRRLYEETGDVEHLMHSFYEKGFLFRRAAKRWLGRDRRIPDTHYSDYSDGRYITLSCTQEEVRPDCDERPDIKEGHEPVIFIGEGKFYTFDRWWVTCENCKKSMRKGESR